ncbi:MAG TPA: hypothetical protein PKO06_02075 [Candidatus Ozemobacteraceae bacterium]|nr:hypothetical protein [Candidatus Ozemobacteraceae bacterium]
MDQAEFAAHPMFQNATVRWDESGIPLPLPEVTRRNLFRRAALLVVLIVFTQLYWHGPKTFWSVDAPYSESRYMPPFYQQVQGAHWETFFADVTAALADPPQGVYEERAADRDVHFLEGEGVLQ